ncbi:MAG TPA: SulP family inorganic anion transporter [Ferrovibrio sp.]|uniref:SulP family inorganic anion transporter n=1 Tax=Ferrovibrio sp. TaxID=1917215 RepID=UPI002ED1F22A
MHSPVVKSEPSFAQLYTPKLITVLREGYSFAKLRADVISGITVAIVAIPLSMAIAIASGTTPDRGLYTAIVGGFLVSAFGGSRFQIGGPAGAFIVLVAAAVERHGIDGLLLAAMMSGAMMLAIGFLRLGTYIKFVPYPVTVGFTAGIAVIISASQIKDLFGLTLAGKEPGELLPKLAALGQAAPTTNIYAVVIAFFTIAVITGLKKFRPHWPGMLVAVGLAAAITALLHLPIETIGTRFGGIPRTPPLPALPHFSLDLALAVLPDAVAFTLLGSIESLLSAIVADGMTGRRHRSNCELVAQGIANIGSALFGGICVTGTVARTATNVRAGAASPISGMLHSTFLLLFMLIAAPLASYIPLAALAAVLAVVAWNMAERHAFVALIRSSWGDAIVLLATFLLTIFVNLTAGILVGFTLGTLLFLHRMSEATSIEVHVPLNPEDKADDANGNRKPYDAALASSRDIMVYRISGAFFFGAAATIGAVLDRIADWPKTFVLDFSAVPFLDSTAANTIASMVKKAERHDTRVVLSGASPAVRQVLWSHGLRPPKVRYKHNIAAAVAAAGQPKLAATAS